MSLSKSEDGHALIIDAGKFSVHLNTPHKFELEKWNEAIKCSMQTAREKVLSITGISRNISKEIHLFDQNKNESEETLREFF